MTWGQINEMARIENFHAMPQAFRNYNNIPRLQFNVGFWIIREYQSGSTFNQVKYFISTKVPSASVRRILRHDGDAKCHSLHGFAKLRFSHRL